MEDKKTKELINKLIEILKAKGFKDNEIIEIIDYITK